MLAGGFGRRMPVEEVPGSEMLQGRMVAFLGCSASTAHRRLDGPKWNLLLVVESKLLDQWPRLARGGRSGLQVEK